MCRDSKRYFDFSIAYLQPPQTFGSTHAGSVEIFLYFRGWKIPSTVYGGGLSSEVTHKRTAPSFFLQVVEPPAERSIIQPPDSAVWSGDFTHRMPEILLLARQFGRSLLYRLAIHISPKREYWLHSSHALNPSWAS